MDMQAMTYAGLGASALALAAFMLWAMAKRANRRAAAEGDIDDRIPKLIDVATMPYQRMIERQDALLDEERTEKRRAQDARDQITARFIEYTTQQSAAHSLEIQKIREDGLASNQRVHQRMDECDRERAALRALVQEAKTRMDNFEAREAARIGAPQINLVQAPLAAAPVQGAPAAAAPTQGAGP